MKKIYRQVALILSCALLVVLVGCGMSNKASASTYSAVSAGFGGDVTVTMVVNEGAIDSLKVEGEKETADIGGAALDTFNKSFESMKGKKISDVTSDAVDVVAGATVTSTAVRNALKDVLAQADGKTVAEKTPVSDSTGNYYAAGNSVASPVEVEVELKDNKIAAITIGENAETAPILQTVVERLVPRIIENQTLGVDAIAGATVSSNAVKDAVAQAIDANGGDSSEWYTPVEKKTDVVKLEGYDVIVVGLGGSGMTAYTSAAQNGAVVFGMETAGKIGGNSATTSGPMAINSQTKMDAQNGGAKFLEEEDLIADWLEYCQGDAKEELVRKFVNESGETMDWLIEDYGFEFADIKAFFHPKQWPVWANYAGDKTEMFTAAIDKAKQANDKNDYMLELTATELIMENGEIKGVKAVLYDGTVYEVYGDSVILATGGFIGNTEMTEEYLGGSFSTEAMLTQDGSGIQMALSAGGDTYNIDMPGMVHIAQTKKIIKSDDLTADQKAVLSAMVLTPESMIVGVDGTRFMNEAGNIAFDNWKGGDTYYSVFSGEQIESFKTNGMLVASSPMFLNQGGTIEANTPIADLDEILRVGEEYGIVVKGDTLEELAEKLGISAQNLVASADAYSSYAGGEEKDPMGKDVALMSSLEEGPYYAVLGAGYYYGTCGGLNIDENCRVLKTDGTAIENLFAVGQDSMGVLFSNKVPYVTYGGAAQGWVLTSGRLAGAVAADAFA